MQILLMTAVAGIAGMGLGALVAAVLGRTSERVMSAMLSFAGGVMIAIVGFELVPEAVELGGLAASAGGLVLGIAVVMILHRLVDRLKISGGPLHAGAQTGNPRLLRSGIIMLVAIALHNVPEGIAIGAAATHDMFMGMVLAAIILLHCIPEGIAVAAPLIGGGMSRAKAVWLTALSGAPTILGGAIGMAVGGISEAALAVALAGAGGAMLYVVFSELLPQSAHLTRSHLTTAVPALVGILVGLIITSVH